MPAVNIGLAKLLGLRQGKLPIRLVLVRPVSAIDTVVTYRVTFTATDVPHLDRQFRSPRVIFASGAFGRPAFTPWPFN